jgi:hypothetical protein
MAEPKLIESPFRASLEKQRKVDVRIYRPEEIVADLMLRLSYSFSAS